MKLVSKQRFEPITMHQMDTLHVTFVRQNVDVVTYVLPKKERRFNCMNVYEADELDGLKEVVIAVLGWED